MAYSPGGLGASKRAGWLTKLVINMFVKYYKVDMKEAQKPDTASYRTFNEFFTAVRCVTKYAQSIPIRMYWSCLPMALSASWVKSKR
ncbi:hypothetical protein ACVXHB_00250 [Escherichia coli]